MSSIGSKTLSSLMIGLIRIYQLGISPYLGTACRFYPSCSCYMEGAIRKHGCIKGVLMGLWRIFKCGPWHPGGHDPVP